MEAGREVWHLMAALNLLGCSTGESRQQQQSPCYGGRSEGKLHAKLGKRLCLVSLPILQDQGWAQKGYNHHHSHSGHF